MKFSQFFSGQRVIRQVLDWLETTKSDSIKERITDSWDDGVVENKLNNMLILGKDVDGTLTDYYHIKIDTGVAYKNGERILIDDASITYMTVNTTHKTDDGLGNLILTPRSTGSWDILLTSGSVNYIYIAYLQTTDDTAFTLHKLTSAKQFYKRTDGYEIQTNITGINPDSARFIFLGQIDLTGTNLAIASNISIVNRYKYRTSLRRIQIETSSTGKNDRPAMYTGDIGGAKQYFLDDHIKAVGTGTIAPTNPHGMTIADLGVAPNQTVDEHRKLEHSNVIIAGTTGDPFPITSAMYCQQINYSPHGPEDYISVKKLVSGQVVIINGIGLPYTSFPSDVILSFVGDPANAYQIIFNLNTMLIEKVAGTSPITDTTKLWLSTVVWNGTDTLVGTPLDRRVIGGSVIKLQRWVTAGRPDSSIVVLGMLGYNVDEDVNKIEYWNGSTWVSL